jgi:hypothetical protein
LERRNSAVLETVSSDLLGMTVENQEKPSKMLIRRRFKKPSLEYESRRLVLLRSIVTIVVIIPRQKTNTKQNTWKDNKNHTQKGKDCRTDVKMYTDTPRLQQFQGTQFSPKKKKKENM